jgi:PPOX class probable FMN-dependent enzyme
MSSDQDAHRADLSTLYLPAHEAVVRKQQDRVEGISADFVATCPLVVLATTSEAGTDASPRGGPPGFVKVLDPTHLAFGDLSGNNRLDSYRNLDAHPEVGMLFLIPGMEETLRVNGRARLTTDPDVRERTAIDGRIPRLAVVVEVTECYIHCAKALRRSGVWDAATWPTIEGRPSAAAGFVAHLGLDVAPEVVEADLEVAYQVTLWEVGGADADASGEPVDAQ